MRLVFFLMVQALYPQDPLPSIRAQGTATATAQPDEARLAIGVTTQAQTAGDASAANAKLASAIIGALKRGFAKTAEISTINYSVNPDFKYAREGGRPTISGYTANNTVMVKTTDIPSVGQMIDVAIKAGATNIHGIEYGLKDDTAVRSQALRMATQEARANAEAMAAAAGLKILRVMRLEEGGVNRVFPTDQNLRMMREAAQAVATPVEARTLQVTATVVLTLEAGK